MGRSGDMTVLMVDRAGAQSIWSLMDALRAALEERGVRVHTCRWDEGSNHEDAGVPGQGDHRIAVPPRRRIWDVVNQHRAFAPAFERLLGTLRPDVVHTNFIVPGGLAAFLARRRGVPVVIATRHELAGSLSPHLRALSAATSRSAHHITYVSDEVARSYRQGEAVEPQSTALQRHLVIRNGVDRGALGAVEPFARPNGAPVVVVGRMVPEKGQARALRAFALAAARDPSLRLELVGDGPDRRRLEAEAERLGLASRVDFCGWRPRAETLARMKASRAVLIPSLPSQEGFGLVLAEAMALGASVIAADIPVFREVSALGSGVALVDAADPDALAARMLDAVPPPAGLSARGDIRHMIDHYLKLYGA